MSYQTYLPVILKVLQTQGKQRKKRLTFNGKPWANASIISSEPIQIIGHLFTNEIIELASQLQSDLQDIVDSGSKWLADFNAGKTELVLFDQSNSTSAIDVKMDVSAFEEKPSFKMLELTLSSKETQPLTLSLLLRLPPRKLESWFVLSSFFLLSLLCISINLPYDHVGNTVVMSGLVSFLLLPGIVR